MKDDIKKGFTLIELLVVISIVSLLSSITLASLKSARTKAADAVIKQSLDNVRTQASIYLSDNGNYGTDYQVGGFPPIYVSNCIATPGTMLNDPKIIELLTAAGKAASGQTGATAMAYGLCGIRMAVSGTPPSWVIAMPLKSAAQLNLQSGVPGAVRGWCVDSAGNSKLITTPFPQTPTSCP